MTVTIAIWNCHSWPLDASTWDGCSSAIWSAWGWATRCLYLGWGYLPVDLPIWPVTIAIWNCHSWPLDASTGGVDLSVNLPIWPVTIEIWNCHSWPLDASTGGGRSVSWSAYMTCNNSNLKLPFLALDASTWGGGTSATAYVTCNNRKLPALATRCLYWWGDQPVDLPIWPVTIAIWNCHSWPFGVRSS